MAKCIVLDLDETLVSSHETKGKPDLPEVDNSGDGHLCNNNTFYYENYRIHKRPHLKEFISFCCENFDRVVVWTAAEKDYANCIVDNVFCPQCCAEGKMKRPSRVMTRSACITKYCPSTGKYRSIKDLKKLWRTSESRKLGINRHSTVVVDDTRETYSRNYGNAIPIRGFYFPPNLAHTQASVQDSTLLDLVSYFETDLFQSWALLRSKEKRWWDVDRKKEENLREARHQEWQSEEEINMS